MTIRVLADEVASQIAAGEVVERPASVVKELLENAIDAGARRITATIEGAGVRRIQLEDDGRGIAQDEIPLAVERHATSKLSTAEDLFHIQTLGFRGEALASIASVSRFTLTSRVADAPAGTRLRVEAGKAGRPEAVATPVGTTVNVEDLFYNLPARLKFLKTDQTERRQIDALVMRYALAYPDLRFHLTHDGKTVFQTTGSGNPREALAALYGLDVARPMIEVHFAEADVKITGFTSPVALTRSNRKEITFFVNGRWVQDSALSAALMQAYHTLLMVGRYPLAVLFVELPPDMVDVNVHPAKAEVRFRSPDRVFSSVQRAARRCLLAGSPAPVLSTPGFPSRPASGDPRTESAPAWGVWRTPQHPAAEEGSRPDPAWEMAADLKGKELPEPISQQPRLTPDPAEGPAAQFPQVREMPLLRLIGQVAQAYLVAEGPDGLYLIDQHAAHERVLFEKFLRNQSLHSPAQVLLEPVTVHLPAASAAQLEGQQETLARIGLELESFGPGTFRVRSVPAVIVGSDPAAAVRAVVENFEEDETPLQSELEARLIARICKRAAVKAGQTLSPEEQRALLRDLESCQSPRTCPHGRPTMIRLPVEMLERQFGRKG